MQQATLEIRPATELKPHAPEDTYDGYDCAYGHTFIEPGSKEVKSHDWYSPDEHYACCPECGSEDFAEVRICGYCGEPVDSKIHTN
jgi:hypothetical protein